MYPNSIFNATVYIVKLVKIYKNILFVNIIYRILAVN